MVLCGFPMNTEKVSMLLQKSEPELLMGSHCFITKVQESRHFGLRDNGPALEGRNWAHLYGTPSDFLPGRAQDEDCRDLGEGRAPLHLGFSTLDIRRVSGLSHDTS